MFLLLLKVVAGVWKEEEEGVPVRLWYG